MSLKGANAIVAVSDFYQTYLNELVQTVSYKEQMVAQLSQQLKTNEENMKNMIVQKDSEIANLRSLAGKLSSSMETMQKIATAYNNHDDKELEELLALVGQSVSSDVAA